MAISGAGGWIPSTGVYVRRGEMLTQPITQNKPREIVYSDIAPGCAGSLADAVDLIRKGKTPQVDVRNFQLIKIGEALKAKL